MMKKTSILSILLLAAITIKAQTTKNFIDQPYIEVTGKAEMEIIPDMIYLKVIIDEKDNKAKVSLEQLEQRMMKALTDIGIDTKKDVSVLDYSSNFQEHWIKKTNIMTTKQYEVLVYKGKTVAQVFMELEKLDISNISVIKLDHSKIEEYRQQVKIDAIKAAKNKAKILTEAVDQKIGKALYIQEISRNIYTRTAAMESNVVMKMSSSNKSGYISDIEFQKINLEAQILARFTIE